jgi:chromatin remodeling complex protein RSC6
MSDTKRSKRPAKSSRKAPAKKAVEVPKVEEVLSTALPVVQEEVKEETTLKVSDDIEELFAQCLALVESEMNSLKENKDKRTTIAFFKGLVKNIKKLRTVSLKLRKRKRKDGSSRPINPNSGFLKPTQISEDFASFAGWNPSELRSRSDVTKFLCKYVKDNKLQKNPTNGKEITPDKKLAEILGYDAKTDGVLDFCSMMKKIQPQFVKEEKVAQ